MGGSIAICESWIICVFMKICTTLCIFFPMIFKSVSKGVSRGISVLSKPILNDKASIPNPVAFIFYVGGRLLESYFQDLSIYVLG